MNYLYIYIYKLYCVDVCVPKSVIIISARSINNSWRSFKLWSRHLVDK